MCGAPNPTALIQEMKNAGFEETFSNHLCTNFMINGHKVQVIEKFPLADPKAAFERFDFTVCCAAIDRKKIFHSHPMFWEDIAARRINVINCPHPVVELQRIVKYAQKGYTPTREALMKIARAINEFDQIDPSEDLTQYPDEVSV